MEYGAQAKNVVDLSMVAAIQTAMLTIVPTLLKSNNKIVNTAHNSRPYYQILNNERPRYKGPCLSPVLISLAVLGLILTVVIVTKQVILLKHVTPDYWKMQQNPRTAVSGWA